VLVWFAVLEGLWAVLVGTQQDTELVGGLAAAALGAIFAETLRSLGLLAYTTDLKLLAQAWKLPWQIVFDFGVLTWVLARSLARGRRVEGVWLTVPFATRDDSVGRWQRAFAVTCGTATPNAIVVDIDRGEALLHSLEPRVQTGREAV
jgi:Na+/H+ ion antiporter subunit